MVKCCRITGPNQRCKALGQADGFIHILVYLPQLLQALVCCLVPLLGPLKHLPYRTPGREWPLLWHRNLAVLDRTVLRWDAKGLAQPGDETEDSDPLAGVATLDDFLPQGCPIAAAGIPTLDQV